MEYSYDFVMFEPLYMIQNHYKDLNNLAVLLKEAGYKVAFVDAFKEKALSHVEGIPHIELHVKCPKEFCTLRNYEIKQTPFLKFYYRIRKDIYLYRIIKKLKGLAPNVYLGSLTLASPVFFMLAFDHNTKYYMWALRSSHVLRWKSGFADFSSLVSRILYKRVKQLSNLRLIVSNPLIKNEFINEVGIEPDRIILRPERFIVKKNNFQKNTGERKNNLNLLFIGTLRPFKNVEFCLEALRRLNNPNIYYTIAGRCKIDKAYDNKINEMVNMTNNAKRIDRYIPDDEYEEIMQNCDFLILCDKKQESCASNGTMSEALLKGKPIIAPDFNPFKFEVETYGVGLLYRYGDLESLCDVILQAWHQGADSFKPNLSAYQEMFMKDEVVKRLKEQL